MLKQKYCIKCPQFCFLAIKEWANLRLCGCQYSLQQKSSKLTDNATKNTILG